MASHGAPSLTVLTSQELHFGGHSIYHQDLVLAFGETSQALQVDVSSGSFASLGLM